MVNTSDRPIVVDGVRLDTLAWNIEKVNRSVAGRREANTQVPGRDGVIPSLNDDLETATFGLDMFVMGTTKDGAVPAEGRRDRFRANLDELVHLFGKRHALLEVTEQVGPGTLMTNWARDPSATTLSSWSNLGNAAQTRALDDTVAHAGAGSIKSTFTNTAAAAGGMKGYMDGTNLRVGDVVRWRVWARSSKAITVRAWWERVGGTYQGGSGNPTPVSLAADTWVAVEGAMTVTQATQGEASTTEFGFGYYSNTDTVINGDAFWSDNLLVTINEPLPTENFNGDSPTSADYTHRWIGAANASRSERVPAGTRRAWAKVTDVIAPEVDLTGSSGRFTVGMELPYGVWEDVTTTDWTKVSPGSGAPYEVTTLQGATERVQDAVLLVQGPITNPRVTDPATGAYVELQMALTAADYWRVNVGTWATRTGNLTLGSTDTAGTDRQAVTGFGGTKNQSAFLPLTPVRLNGQRRVRVALSGTGMTAATAVSVRARRKFAL